MGVFVENMYEGMYEWNDGYMDVQTCINKNHTKQTETSRADHTRKHNKPNSQNNKNKQNKQNRHNKKQDKQYDQAKLNKHK
jgi:hypothetical protein